MVGDFLFAKKKRSRLTGALFCVFYLVGCYLIYANGAADFVTYNDEGFACWAVFAGNK